MEPLRELHFATHGSKVFFQYPDGSWSGHPNPDQVIFHQVIELDPLRAKIPTVTERDPASAGRLVRRRGVMGNKPTFAGTRIPLETVQRYLDAGWDTEAILAEYPSLTPADVEAARNYAALSSVSREAIGGLCIAVRQRAKRLPMGRDVACNGLLARQEKNAGLR